MWAFTSRSSFARYVLETTIPSAFSPVAYRCETRGRCPHLCELWFPLYEMGQPQSLLLGVLGGSDVTAHTGLELVLTMSSQAPSLSILHENSQSLSFPIDRMWWMT